MAWASQDYFWWYLSIFHLVQKYSSKVLRYNYKKIHENLFAGKQGTSLALVRDFSPLVCSARSLGLKFLWVQRSSFPWKWSYYFLAVGRNGGFLVWRFFRPPELTRGWGLGGFYLQGSRDKLLWFHRGGIAALGDTHQWRSLFLYLQLLPHPWWKKGEEMFYLPMKLGGFFPLFRTSSWKACSEHLQDKWKEICHVKSSSSSVSAFLCGDAATEKSLPRRDYLPESLLQAWQALKCLL